MTTKVLIDDYLRRINTLNLEIAKLETTHQIEYMQNQNKKTRLETKRSCYRAFIAELQRIV